MESVLQAYAEPESDSEPEPEPQSTPQKRIKRRATFVPHEPDESVVPHEPDESDDEDDSRKKRAPNEQRDFQLVDEWSREEMDDETILTHIRKHLDDLNSSSGIQVLPCSHKDRKNVFGTFQFRRKWVTNNGKVLNTVVNCPLEHRCKCRCQAKIVESPDTTYLFIADAHTAADHVSEKDSSKYLKYSQQAFIAYRLIELHPRKLPLR